jgi:hypothetical protein
MWKEKLLTIMEMYLLCFKSAGRGVTSYLSRGMLCGDYLKPISGFGHAPMSTPPAPEAPYASESLLGEPHSPSGRETPAYLSMNHGGS